MDKLKTLLPVALVIVLVALGLYSVAQKRAGVPVVSENEASMVKETDALSVDIKYPAIPGVTDDVAAANASIKADINAKVASFEKDAIENMELAVGLPAEIKSTVTGGGGVEEANERYASVFFGAEWYARGAAHPFHTMDTYIYDYEQKKLVSVPELFLAGSDYLALLSAYSRSDLLMQSKEGDLGFVYREDMVMEGTQPLAKNFNRMLPLKDGLAIYFEEYQVAPYAAGPQQVVIPYDRLKDVIDPSGVLGIYLK